MLHPKKMPFDLNWLRDPLGHAKCPHLRPPDRAPPRARNEASANKRCPQPGAPPSTRSRGRVVVSRVKTREKESHGRPSSPRLVPAQPLLGRGQTLRHTVLKDY